MNKKFISSLVVLAIVMNVSSLCFAAEKKDVTDPVLREMINSLSTKMPKFINQYGASVFVADEKVTRGALIKALYEYDKKMGGGASSVSSSDGDLTRKQYTALSNRITALERNSSSTTGKAAAKSGSYDIVAVMNDLEPNMPMLLDNTLIQSKVFRDLQKKVNLVSNATVSNEGSSSLKADDKTVLALRKQIAMLNKKVDDFETTASAGSLTDKEYNLLETRIAALEKNSASITGKSVSSSEDAKTMLALRKQVAALNKKIDNFELELASASTDKSSLKDKNSKTSLNSDELTEMKATLKQIQKSYVAMSKRVNELENNQSALAAVPSTDKDSKLSNAQMKNINLQIASIKKTVENIPTSDYVDAEIQKANMQTAKDIKRIEYRLNNLGKSENFNEGSSRNKSKSDSEGSSTTGTIAKVSLGLTMIAALFIAR